MEQKRKSDPAEFKKRLRNLVQKTKQGRRGDGAGRRFWMGGRQSGFWVVLGWRRVL